MNSKFLLTGSNLPAPLKVYRPLNEYNSRRKIVTVPQFVVTILMVLLTGCASTNQFVEFPDQNKPFDNPENARIYVLRPGAKGWSKTMTVNDGDIAIGKIGPKGYICWERKPNKTKITSASGELSIQLDAQKNTTYYIIIPVSRGYMAGNIKLELIDPERGIKLLKKCKKPAVTKKTLVAN